MSEFSKSEIAKYYGVPASKMDVVYNAWQQMQRIAPDEGIFARHPQLKHGQYYFSMANLLKNKNFPWVLRAAGAKPDAVFAIAGGGSLAAEAERLGLADLPNVLYLGYVSDGAAKALMAHCKAFLFPTLYEGFGIPPLEAAACGAPQIIVSDTPCMREVYGPCAAYIDLPANSRKIKHCPPLSTRKRRAVFYIPNFLSNVLYCRVSDRCAVSSTSLPSRSATVRATRRMRS